MITVAVAAWPGDRGKQTTLRIPVSWSCKTNVTSNSGILSSTSKGADDLSAGGWLARRLSQKEQIEIKEGVFIKKINLEDLTVVRLVKSGSRAPRASIPSEKRPKGLKRPLFETSSLRISTERPPPTILRIALLETKNATPPVCRSTRFESSIVPATRGVVGKIPQVTPWDAKSVMVVHKSKKDKTTPSETWAEIRFEKPPKNAAVLSFWVRPSVSLTSSKKKTRSTRRRRNVRKQTVFLRLSYLDLKKNGTGVERFLSIRLPPEAWSRIELAKSKSGFLPDRLRVLPPPTKRKGRGIRAKETSYELNGICALGADVASLRSARLASTGMVRRAVPSSENECDGSKEQLPKMEERNVKILLLFGIAGKVFEYRRTFSEPMVFRTVKALTKFGSPRLVWRKDAQILEVGGRFPATPPSRAPQKSHSKQQASEIDSPTPKEILIAKLADKLTPNEKKFLKRPNSSLIAIRLESLK